jgi:hypothetical protein
VRVVDAVWEQRNLGVSCAEITLGPADGLDALEPVLDGLTKEYQVVKVPAGRLDVMQALQSRGFTFVEAALEVEHRFDLPELTGVLRRLVDSVEYVELGDDDWQRVAERIHGGLFETDRVFLDPMFSPDQAASRYVNWMRDELDRGASLYELRFRSEGVAFFLFREGGDRVGYSVLSGLYEAAQTPGLGTVLLHQILVEGSRRNLRLLSSSISGNNLPVVKTHVALGFSILAVHYVYIRHLED